MTGKLDIEPLIALKVCLICRLYRQLKHHKIPFNVIVSAAHLTHVCQWMVVCLKRNRGWELFPTVARCAEVLGKKAP